MPSRYGIPPEMEDAALLVETGWAPDILDGVPVDRLAKYLLYKNIKDIAQFGGEYTP